MARPKNTPATTPDPTLPDTITLSRADLAAMIAEALQAREAEAEETKVYAPPPGMELAKAIGDAVAEGMAKNNPTKVKYAQFLKRGTANHPKGLLSPKFTAGRVYFQNGRLVPYDSINDAAVVLLNSITHSGRYIDRRVEVIMRDEGGDNQSVDLRYKSASIDDRIENKSHWRNFNELVQRIVDEQTVEREEDEAHPRRQVTRRPFGNGKNTLAAEEAAGA